MTRKAKLEKALAFDEFAGMKNDYVEGRIFENARLAPLHEALVAAVEALKELQLGHVHEPLAENIRVLGDTYGWCYSCNTKVSFEPGIAEEALAKIDKVLGEK